MKNNIGFSLMGCSAAALIIGVMWVLFTFLVMWSWNAVFPYVFEWPSIEWGHAFGLVVIFSVFGNFLRSVNNSS